MKALRLICAALAVLILLDGCKEKTGPESIKVIDVGPVQTKKKRPWYHKGTFYAKGLTDAQVQEKVSEIMRGFTMPEERWNECLTYQDFLVKKTKRPRTVPEADYMAKIRKRVAVFYHKLQGPPTYLKDVRIPGLRYAGRVKDWDKLSRKERLLLQRYYPFKVLPEDELEYWQSDLLLTVFSALMRNWWSRRNQFTTSRAEQLFTDYFDMRYMLDPRNRLKGDEWDLWVQRWLYEYTSPVTGKIFEPWHKTFSAGNGYFRLVTDKGAVDQLWEYLSEADQTNFPRRDTYFMYYRVYGERKVIAEGFYAGYVGAKPVER